MPKQPNDGAAEFPFIELAEKGFSVPEMNAAVAFERYEDGYRETGNVLFAFLAFYEAYRPRGPAGPWRSHCGKRGAARRGAAAGAAPGLGG